MTTYNHDGNEDRHVPRVHPMTDELAVLRARLDAAEARAAEAEAAQARLRGKLEAAETERDEAVDWSDIVDRHGTDRFDDLAEKWLAMEPIQRVHNAVTSVFSKWANDELMARFKQHMANSLQMAFVEGCLVGVRAAESKARAEKETNDD